MSQESKKSRNLEMTMVLTMLEGDVRKTFQQIKKSRNLEMAMVSPAIAWLQRLQQKQLPSLSLQLMSPHDRTLSSTCKYNNVNESQT